MKSNQQDKVIKRSLFSLRDYVLFFIQICFIVTCCFLLFLDAIDLDRSQIEAAALKTFLNIFVLSLLCTLVVRIHRKRTVERPVKVILEATEKIKKGDFNTRIEPFHGIDRSDEFDAIIDDLNQMAEELSSVETLRTDFIANVSHELKTPLAVIQNYGVMLQSPKLSEEKRIAYAKSVTQASRRLANLISNILKLNKLENQRLVPEVKPYDVCRQLCECALSFENLWEKKEIELEMDIEDMAIIEADKSLLELVWNNLFSNAIKFTEPGGHIMVRQISNEEYVKVSVSDTGCGMSQESMKHILDKFYQGDSSHSTEGNGLGLALVKRVLELMDGEIQIASRVGEGSTFTVILPAAEWTVNRMERR